MNLQDPVDRIKTGHGRISLVSHGSRAVFAELSSAYPLKLLSPRLMTDQVALAYLLTYGGGLVGGDQINMKIEVDVGSMLVLLSQGSTKVFQRRPGFRQASAHDYTEPVVTTRQIMDASIEGALFLLPEPVTCFRSASYDQVQRFHLSGGASTAILDWVTSGRQSLGEEWAFSRYYSENEVWINGERVIKDVMLLEAEEVNPKLPSRSLHDKLAPYTCYATLILLGPLLQPTIEFIANKYDRITVFKDAVIRVAGKETEVVKKWLKHCLSPVEALMGSEAFRKAFF